AEQDKQRAERESADIKSKQAAQDVERAKADEGAERAFRLAEKKATDLEESVARLKEEKAKLVDMVAAAGSTTSTNENRISTATKIHDSHAEVESLRREVEAAAKARDNEVTELQLQLRRAEVELAEVKSLRNLSPKASEDRVKSPAHKSSPSSSRAGSKQRPENSGESSSTAVAIGIVEQHQQPSTSVSNAFAERERTMVTQLRKDIVKLEEEKLEASNALADIKREKETQIEDLTKKVTILEEEAAQLRKKTLEQVS
ncbi:unnamed protein product, partial [Amoebophrya sp. A25]